MTGTLLFALDSSWSAADPAALTPDHAARLAELQQLDAALASLYARGAEVLAGAPDANALRDRHTALLGRERGVVTLALAEMPKLSPEEKKTRGKGLNLVKRWLGEVHDARREALEREREAADALDVTLPGRRPWTGRPHVLSQVRDDLLDLFHGLGFSVYTSPEVELDEYNFGKLNFAPDHPARDAHDTYFVNPDVVLRTHTSPGWVRAMEALKPPMRLVFPGRVYRAEAVDASHMDQFHQIDGLFVDRNVSMADLKATLNTFARAIYRADLPTRIIPIYFPFVEPGVQMDVQCVRCEGTGRVKEAEGDKRCPVCKGTKWVEVLGAGMVHPNVFRAVGIDPEEWTGFAFGMGLERIAMGRYGIPEIRLFLENDVRFLRQF
jgi:phenylalanyl-tRNA synthetase alpha chain